jgi:cytoskeletal protein CcmA (bactofilin family)
MAMFSANTTGERPARPKASAEHGLSILAQGMYFTGEIRSDGVVKIEGTVEGTVRADGQILVARGGVVLGDLHTREAVIGGEVRGAIFAEERLEAQATSVITGDIQTPKFLVHDGGQINGKINMKRPELKKQEASPKAAPTPSAKADRPFEVVGEVKPAKVASAGR